MEYALSAVSARSRLVYAIYVKPMIDYFGAFLLLLLLGPVALLAMLAIWLESGSPVIFAQERCGFGGKVFRMYKLRGLVVALSVPSVDECHANQPRATRVGRFIRAVRIDEIPQLVNVLRGEMSLIGPRPLPVSMIRALKAPCPDVHRRHAVRPGLLGYASVVLEPAHCIELELQKVLKDLDYVDRLGPRLDLWILLNAPGALVRQLKTG